MEPGAIVELDGQRYVLVPAPRACNERPRGPEPAMVSRLHRALAQSEGDNSLSLTDVAHQLGLPARTLAQRLRQEGTTFTRERERFRRERSLLRVVQSDTPLTTIALDLGFADLASFCRAFRGWYRCAASTLRRNGSSG